MKKGIALAAFLVGTIVIARLLLTSAIAGHWMNEINYSAGFGNWRVRNGWTGIESEEDLWTYICLLIGMLISLPISIILYRRIR
jgi:hypothetical protein